MELFVEAFNETVRGFNCIFSLHNCYSNYKILAKYAPKLQNCGQLALEFANRDNSQIGLDNIRKSYKEIKFFEEYGFSGNYGLGVIDVHSNFVEPPELIRDRILYAAKIVGDSSRIWVNPDCGLRTRSWDVSFQKLKNMVLGAELARQSLE
jgi:5-methyltetrahydropteroyltriglutamate--homocysteine methyltransferase